MNWNPKLTQRELCEQLGWVSADGKPNTGKVSRLIGKLHDSKSLDKDGLNNWYVTEKGKRALGLSPD
jgi:hypothetical protein